MFKLLLAGLRAHRQRLLLAALATLIGTAFVAGTLVLSDTMQTNTQRTIVGNAAKVDAAVVADNQLRKLDAQALHRIAALPGVRTAQGQVQGDITLVDRNGRRSSAQPIGISVTVRTNITQGRAPRAAGEAVLAEQTAKATGVSIGGTVTVLDAVHGKPASVRVTGLMNTSGQGQLALQGAVGFTEATAAKLVGDDKFAEIYVQGTDPQRLRTEIAGIVGNGPYTVYTGTEYAHDQAAGSGIDPTVLRIGLLMFALVALLVAGFVIYNTFTILVAQRTRELALQRCVGASRRQVFAAVLGESVFVGLAASLLGLALGIGAGYVLLPLMNSFGAGISTSAFTVSSTTVLISVLAGLLTTVAAALLPARGATRVAPVAALRALPEGESNRMSRVRIVVAVLFAVLGAGAAVAGLNSSAKGTPLVMVAGGGMLFFLGVLALGPLLVPPLAVVLGAPLRAFGTAGRLAVANARRNPKRAATTIMALTIGVTLATGVSVVTESLKSSVGTGVGKAIPVDYEITPPGNDPSGTLPRAVYQKLRGTSGVTEVSLIREAPVEVGGEQAMLSTAVGGKAPGVLSGSLRGLSAQDVVLRPERAKELGVRVGGTLTVTVRGEPQQLHVAAIATGDTFPRMYVSPAAFEHDFPGRGDSAVLANVSHELSPEQSRALINAGTSAAPTAKIVSTYDAQQRLASTLDQVTLLITAMLALAVFISLVGIANTMTLSVLERSRESALLRALGLASRQLRLMLTTEALLFGVIGGLLGVVLGVGFGLAAARVINDNVLLQLPYLQIVLIVLGSGVAGMLAALLPARRATRTSIVRSLTGE